MDTLRSSRPLAIFIGIAMIAAGLGLAIWAVTTLPGDPQQEKSALATLEETPNPDTDGLSAAAPDNGSAAGGSETDTENEAANGAASGTSADAGQAPAIPIRVDLLPAALVSLGPLVDGLTISNTSYITDINAVTDETITVRIDLDAVGGRPVYDQLYTVSTRFDTINPGIGWTELTNAWKGRRSQIESIVVLTDTLPALSQILGDPGSDVIGVATTEDAVQAAWNISPTITILPFEQLTPSLVVFPIDGQNPIENANNFDVGEYPLVTTFYAHDDAQTPQQSARVGEFLAQVPEGNRLAEKLTVIAMTGVTAMVRGTAAKMDEYGPEWVAEVVGPVLASADITHISNEVPFVADCETNTDPNNLTFCSSTDYMAALEKTGVDIIGLTGNHQNDYGYDDAIDSLKFYAEHGLPVYGGGEDRESAMKPLYLEHNGNKLAFLGANSFGPRFAWSTEFYPGSAPFDLNIMSATIREIKEEGLANVVLTELQYQERYDVAPLAQQRDDFNALVRTGSDIVTGVQSHVPQAIEFTDGHLILYGLGNLFFDQMWEEQTREGIIAKHTIYDNRHISTQLLTTLLYDYGQPQWTTPEENERILERVFDASFWEY